jgi:hypothetical protein
MNIKYFYNLGLTEQLGNLNCKNGYPLMKGKSNMLYIPFSYLFPVIYYPEGALFKNEIFHS